jgi:hypothetical protein
MCPSSTLSSVNGIGGGVAEAGSPSRAPMGAHYSIGQGAPRRALTRARCNSGQGAVNSHEAINFSSPMCAIGSPASGF